MNGSDSMSVLEWFLFFITPPGISMTIMALALFCIVNFSVYETMRIFSKSDFKIQDIDPVFKLIYCSKNKPFNPKNRSNKHRKIQPK